MAPRTRIRASLVASLQGAANASGEPVVRNFEDWRLFQFDQDGLGSRPFGFEGVGRETISPFTSDEVIEVAQWLADREWLGYFLTKPMQPGGPDDCGPFEWPVIVSDLESFLRRFGDLMFRLGSGATHLEIDSLVDGLALARLALRTAMAFGSSSRALEREVLSEWVDLWESPPWEGWLADLSGFDPSLGDPPYPARLRRPLVRYALGSWAAAFGVQVHWPFDASDRPLEPRFAASSGLGLVFLTCGITAGAVKGGGVVETLGTCDECGAIFVADRRRKRGGQTMTFCSTKCGNRNRARRFRATQSKEGRTNAK